MKILFLDIDGPLAISKNFIENSFYITKNLKKIKSIIKHQWDSGERVDVNECVKVPYGWHNKSCKTLADLIEEEDLKIVISSDWKRHYNEDDLALIFRYNKIPSDRIIGRTGYAKFGHNLERSRMAEIEIWVNEWKENNLGKKLSWVTVDDMDLSGLGETHYVCVLNGLASPGIKEKIINCYKEQNEK